MHPVNFSFLPPLWFCTFDCPSLVCAFFHFLTLEVVSTLSLSLSPPLSVSCSCLSFHYDKNWEDGVCAQSTSQSTSIAVSESGDGVASSSGSQSLSSTEDTTNTLSVPTFFFPRDVLFTDVKYGNYVLNSHVFSHSSSHSSANPRHGNTHPKDHQHVVSAKVEHISGLITRSEDISDGDLYRPVRIVRGSRSKHEHFLVFFTGLGTIRGRGMWHSSGILRSIYSLYNRIYSYGLVLVNLIINVSSTLWLFSLRKCQIILSMGNFVLDSVGSCMIAILNQFSICKHASDTAASPLQQGRDKKLWRISFFLLCMLGFIFLLW